MTVHVDPWDDPWRLAGTRGHITPGCAVCVHAGRWMHERPGPDPGEPPVALAAGTTALVLARLNDPELHDNGERIGWDDLLVVSTTRQTGWISMDPSDPWAVQLASSPECMV